jgi:DNA-binding GntR family transcriptional regulator
VASQPQTKTDWVYDQLRGQIADGRFAPGTPLRLGALAEEFNVSEMPVREALRMLHRDGLVEMQSHRGAVVTDIDWDEMAQAVAVRMHLELLAIAEATPHHDERSLKRCETLMDKMEQLEQRGEGRRFSEANRAFHTALYEPAPVPLLKTTIENLWDRMWQSRTRSLYTELPRQMETAQQEHRAILDAVAAGDVKRAVSALRTHRTTTLAAWERAKRGAEGGVAASEPVPSGG